MTAIDIDSLVEAFDVSPQNDFMIVENQPEQATSKATVSKVQSINLRNLPILSGSMTLGDVFFGEQSSTADRFCTNFDDVTFPSGTKTWVYSDRVPLGWTTVSSTGDKLLAVKGGSVFTTGGVSAGAWMMEGVNGGNPGSALSVEQMAPHTHYGKKSQHVRDSGELPDNNPPRKGKVEEDDDFPPYRFFVTEPEGGNQSHNHGDSWRPKAYVGLIIEKI